MVSKAQTSLLAFLDVGTSKVTACVVRLSAQAAPQVVAHSTRPSRGMKRGVVVNIESVVQTLTQVMQELQKQCGVKIKDVYTNLSGGHIRSLNSHGIVPIRQQVVTLADVDRVIDAARAVAIPADQRIFHILPQAFTVDDQEDIREPVGMSGVRLEAKVHMITGAVSAANNIMNALKRCQLSLSDLMVSALASAEAVLHEDEKELGVCLVDIGGGTTDIAVYVGGSLRHTAVIPIAGDQVTNDLAVALRTPAPHAESLKQEHGSLMDVVDQSLSIQGVGGASTRHVPRQGVRDVMHARYAELLALVRSELSRAGLLDWVPAGVVLTGGASVVPGCVALAEQTLGMPVRLGQPEPMEGLQVTSLPAYATVAGLMQSIVSQQQVPTTQGAWSEGVSWIGRLKAWFAAHL